MTNRAFFGLLACIILAPILLGAAKSLFEPKTASADQTSISYSAWRMANSLERIEQPLREKNCK